MSHILITGANGQLGTAFYEISSRFSEFIPVFADKAQLDITSEASIAEYFDRHQFTYCINCAAYTAVDKAETNQTLAENINIHGPQLLAKYCKDRSITFFHFSTDYVYHTLVNQPYLEGDLPQPRNIYARTKLAGDEAVLETYPESIILRTSWVYSHTGKNFVKTMIRLGKERPSLNVVFDQIGTPTYAPDLAEAVIHIFEKLEAQPELKKTSGGVYHFSNEGVSSWYDFALAIFDIMDIDCKVTPIESKDYPTPAQRPFFSVLNKRKIKEAFDIEIPHWRDSLKSCLERVVEGRG